MDDPHSAQRADHKAKRSRAARPIVLILALGLGVGIWLGNDYGVSWDEVRNADVGADVVGLIFGSREYFSNPSLADHGPVYFTLFSAGSRVISRLVPALAGAAGRALLTFAPFLV